MPRCSICSHDRRTEIETLLLENESLRDVAGRFSVSKSALARHKEAHISARLAQAKVTQEATAAGTLMDRLRALNAEVRTLLTQAKEARDLELTLRVIARAETQLALEARLLTDQAVLNGLVHDLMLQRMSEAVLRLKARFGSDPVLLQQIVEALAGPGYRVTDTLPGK